MGEHNVERSEPNRSHVTTRELVDPIMTITICLRLVGLWLVS